MKESKEIKNGEQLNFDFEKKPTPYEIGQQYKIYGDDIKNIKELDGKYFYMGEDIDEWRKKEDKKWEEEKDELYRTKDSDELYKRK